MPIVKIPTHMFNKKPLPLIFSLIALALTLLALWGVGNLSLKEFQTGNGCPKISGVPVCHVITICVLILLFSQIFFSRFRGWMFSVGAGLPWGIALLATYFQFNGIIECPKSDGGTPMCYLSLALFSGIFLFKWLESKSDGKSD